MRFRKLHPLASLSSVVGIPEIGRSDKCWLVIGFATMPTARDYKMLIENAAVSNPNLLDLHLQFAELITDEQESPYARRGG